MYLNLNLYCFILFWHVCHCRCLCTVLLSCNDGLEVVQNLWQLYAEWRLYLEECSPTTVLSLCQCWVRPTGEGVIYEKTALPYQQVRHIESARLCSKCKENLETTKRVRMCCVQRPRNVFCNIRNSYNANLYFENGGGGFTVTVFPDQATSLITLFLQGWWG